MGVALVASLALSAGSAMGVAALAVQLDAPAESGYIAEVGLTGLTTTVILYRSHLAQHGGRLTGWKSCVLWLLMVAPLVASMVANAIGVGAVGVCCSAGAAAFSLLSYVIADASAEALLFQASLVSGTDEVNLRMVATTDDLLGVGSETHNEVRSQTQVPELTGPRSETHESDRSEGRSETQVPDPIENGSTDRSEEQVPDPTGNGSADQVPDQVPNEASDPKDEKVSDPSKAKPKSRKRTPAKPKPPRPLDRLAEAQSADRAYLAAHGRHIPAEKLASALRIGKPAALELVKQVRGAQMDIAK
jgi:hypothetical protein